VNAGGWYVDPFGLHQARWFSDGRPTCLVRDDGAESDDAPPDASFDGPLEAKPERQTHADTDLLTADRSDPDAIPGDGPFEAFGESGGEFD
jgi:hypothetical protein